MNFTTMTLDELADAAKALLDEMHARQAALPAGALSTRAGRFLRLAHGALDGLRGDLADNGAIHPDSGGGNKGASS